MIRNSEQNVVISFLSCFSVDRDLDDLISVFGIFLVIKIEDGISIKHELLVARQSHLCG